MTMGAKRPVAQDLGHQPVKGVGNLAQAEAALVGLKRETKAGDRRCYDGEGVTGVAPVPRRMRQQRNEPLKFNDRARPTVRQQQWERRVALPPFVDEMQIDAIDRHLELLQTIECAFVGAPVITTAPIVDQALEVLKLGSEGPA